MTKKGWLSRLTEGLKKTSDALSEKITKIFTHTTLDPATLEDLEDVLIQGDLGVATAGRIIDALRRQKVEKEATAQDIQNKIAEAIAADLSPYVKTLDTNHHTPHVIMMVGVNGTGKTTTCAKVACGLQQQGKSVAIAACDTFRAAAVEQLEIWGKRLNIPIIKGGLGADPAGLAYDAYAEAVRQHYDVLLIDTAGRLHTNDNLMAELGKINRVLKKVHPDLPHDCFMVIDATIGQNAYTQLDLFQKIAPITGLIITKLDGTARGGVVVGLTDRFKLPLYAIGVGEAAEDLLPFNAQSFASALAGTPPPDHNRTP